jgi:hypothetical protein
MEQIADHITFYVKNCMVTIYLLWDDGDYCLLPIICLN